MAVAKRFVEEAVEEKKFVVVAEVPVAFVKVKSWKIGRFANPVEVAVNFSATVSPATESLA